MEAMTQRSNRGLATPNALHPDHMTADERLDEVARLLAAGIIRARNRRMEDQAKTKAKERDVSLDFTARQRGSDRTKNRRGEKT